MIRFHTVRRLVLVAVVVCASLRSAGAQSILPAEPASPANGRASELLSAVRVAPVLLSLSPRDDIQPGTTLQVRALNLDSSSVAMLGGRLIVPRWTTSPLTILVDVPADQQSGWITLKLRRGGMESNALRISVRAPGDGLTGIVQGQAFYQKVDVTDDGLDPGRTHIIPIRNARVEVVDRVLQRILSVGETNDRGQFRVPVPLEAGLTVRVVSRLVSPDVVVADNTNGNVPYSIAADIDMREALLSLTLVDTSRVSGAFNILEMIGRSNALLAAANPSSIPPAMTIFWSVRNTKRSGSVRDGLVGTTSFNAANGTAYVLGDRAVDSDEFDDAVVVHEYAHLLAARFSRDDSPGGEHGLGYVLDPRVAWSEGFADFFSGAVRRDPIYRDSRGPEGSAVLRYDLEPNVPVGDSQGYWSESSVSSLLWDLYDANVDDGDVAQFSIAAIWSAVTDLRNDRYVYLPYFLDHFVERNPDFADDLRTMVQLRAIDFQPGIRPSVSNPFPRTITIGESVIGEVDSVSLRRINLMQSAHFFAFETDGGPTVVKLDIQGTGAGNNPNANDLDLYLLDGNGRVLYKSDGGLNAQPEVIAARLTAGRYVVEVRSYYRRVDTGEMSFNSGRYRLTLSAQ